MYTCSISMSCINHKPFWLSYKLTVPKLEHSGCPFIFCTHLLSMSCINHSGRPFLSWLVSRSQVWLLRSVMSAWFVVGWLRPRRRRLRHLAAARLHAEAQRLIAATADVAPAPAPAAPEIRWTPLVGKGRGQGLLLSLLKSHDFWAQKASLRAWRLQVAKERAFSAMLELTLEDGETFLASPVKRPARHVEVRWADGLRDLSDSDEQRLRRAES